MSKRSIRKVRHYKAQLSFKDLTWMGVYRGKLARAEMTLDQVPERYRQLFEEIAKSAVTLNAPNDAITDVTAALQTIVNDEVHVHGEHCDHGSHSE